MTHSDLNTWVKDALSNNINEHTVPWVTAGNPLGFELALQWIDAKEEHIATAGWSALANIVALKPDTELDLPRLNTLLDRVAKTIHTAPNRVRYHMNGFVTAVGIYVAPLTKAAIATAKAVGPVSVDMNGTACKVPDAGENIAKAETRGVLGKKKKTVKC